MNFSIPAIIRDLAAPLVAPDHGLSCSGRLWREGMNELRRRGRGERESGAFLLGSSASSRGAVRRRITRFVYYDDLDPECLDTGIVVFHAVGFGPLWKLCRDAGLSVVADVHTHPGAARQSDADRRHPMIATGGHFAVIVPNFAQSPVALSDFGLYEYRGAHQWTDRSGRAAVEHFYIGFWG